MTDKKDVTLATIRQVRHCISERFGHDPQQVIMYYIELQRQYAERLLPIEAEAWPEEASHVPHLVKQLVPTF